MGKGLDKKVDTDLEIALRLYRQLNGLKVTEVEQDPEHIDIGQFEADMKKPKPILIGVPETEESPLYQSLFESEESPFKKKKYDLKEITKIKNLPEKNKFHEFENLEYIINEFNFELPQKEYIPVHTPDVEDQHADLQAYIANFFSDEKLSLGSTLTETEFTEMSQEFAERIRAMSKTISPEEISSVASMLKMGPLLVAASGLGQVLADPSTQPSTQLRDKTKQLIQVYEAILGQSTLAKLLDTPVSRISIDVFDPEAQSVRDLDNLLQRSGACTATGSGLLMPLFQKYDKLKGASDAQLLNSPASRFLKDMKAGGSIHVGINSNTGHSYNRLYVAVSKEGKPFLFYDCVESQDMMLRSVEDYVKRGIGDRLIASFATSVVLANRLGIDTVALGEDEILTVGKGLGFSERKMFGKGSNGSQKLGYRTSNSPRGGDGPYAWRLAGQLGQGNDKSFTVMDPRLYDPSAVASVIAGSYQVMDRINKKAKPLKTFRDEFEAYFGIVQELIVRSEGVIDETDRRRALADVDAFCDKFNLNTDDTFSPQARAKRDDYNYLPDFVPSMAA